MVLPQKATSLYGTLLAFVSLVSCSASPSAFFVLHSSFYMSPNASCQNWRYGKVLIGTSKLVLPSQ